MKALLRSLLVVPLLPLSAVWVPREARAQGPEKIELVQWKPGPNVWNAWAGAALLQLPDLDGDGIPELLFTAPNVGLGDPQILSGASLKKLGSLPTIGVASCSPGWIGGNAALAGDVNGDGHQDVVLGSPSVSFNRPVIVYSLVKMKKILAICPPPSPWI